VELILRKLSEGATKKELLDAYPKLTQEDIQAAMRYAADTLAHEETVVLNPQNGQQEIGPDMRFLADESCDFACDASGTSFELLVSVERPG